MLNSNLRNVVWNVRFCFLGLSLLFGGSVVKFHVGVFKFDVGDLKSDFGVVKLDVGVVKVDVSIVKHYFVILYIKIKEFSNQNTICYVIPIQPYQI